jgi:hypothetical protein
MKTEILRDLVAPSARAPLPAPRTALMFTTRH